MVWQLPMSLVKNLFDKTFWRDVVAQKGANALNPTPILGYRRIPGVNCECPACLRNAATIKSQITGRLEDFYARSPHLAAQLKSRGDDPPQKCPRRWGFWPYGGTAVRLHAHAQNMDFRSCGVPSGYVSLLDGTIVLQQLEMPLKKLDFAHLEMNVRRAQRILAICEKPIAGEAEDMKARREQVGKVLQEMLSGDAPLEQRDLVRRSVVGVPEIWAEPQRFTKEDVQEARARVGIGA